MPDTYNDIDSGKLVNKSGLLELSVKIKEYVDNNSSSSSVELPFDIIEYQSTFANYSAEDLQHIYNLGHSVAGTKPVIIKKDGVFYTYVGFASGYRGVVFGAFAEAGMAVSSIYKIVYFKIIAYTHGANDTTITSQSAPASWDFQQIAGISVGINSSSLGNIPSGLTHTDVESEFRYIGANYTKTANLAAVALSNSYNDLNNKPTIPSYTAGTGISIDANNEISCTITDTNTTYTAGTGISITNGVISLDLPVANGVSY